MSEENMKDISIVERRISHMKQLKTELRNEYLVAKEEIESLERSQFNGYTFKEYMRSFSEEKVIDEIHIAINRGEIVAAFNNGATKIRYQGSLSKAISEKPSNHDKLTKNKNRIGFMISSGSSGYDSFQTSTFRKHNVDQGMKMVEVIWSLKVANPYSDFWDELGSIKKQLTLTK